jgi:hypothetical protein
MVEFNVFEYRKFVRYYRENGKSSIKSYSESMIEEGYKSAKYNPADHHDNWMMDDNDFTMFVLKWG